MHHALTNQTSHPANVPSARRTARPQGACGRGWASVERLGPQTYVHLGTRLAVPVDRVCRCCQERLRGPH